MGDKFRKNQFVHAIFSFLFGRSQMLQAIDRCMSLANRIVCIFNPFKNKSSYE
jgi:hypothetical protein